jgi:hypothetical protein
MHWFLGYCPKTQKFKQRKNKMPSLAATQGIAFSAKEIRAALEAAAISGFTGTLQLSINLRPDAAQCVVVSTNFKHSHLEGKPADTRQELPNPTLKKPVSSVIEVISPKLFIRPAVTALEARFLKGVLQPHWTHDE